MVHGMLDHRSNALVEAIILLMQQSKCAAQGLKTAANLMAIAYLYLGKLRHLPPSPFLPAVLLAAGVTRNHL